MKRASLTAAACLALLCWGEAARAWIPPSDFLEGRLADKRKSMHGFSAKGIRTFLGKSVEGGKQDIAVEIWATSDGLYREEQHAPKGDHLVVSDGKKLVTVNDGAAAPAKDDPRSLEQLILTGASKDDFIRAIRAWNIHDEVVTLGRLENKVCWVVGGKPGDTSAAELWIDKDRMLPLQLLDPQNRRKLVFSGWGEGPGGGMLPARMVWYHGNDIEQELRLDEAKINPKLPASLFKPEEPVP